MRHGSGARILAAGWGIPLFGSRRMRGRGIGTDDFSDSRRERGNTIGELGMRTGILNFDPRTRRTGCCAALVPDQRAPYQRLFRQPRSRIINMIAILQNRH